MKIAICSDLHLEFGNIILKNPGDVAVLILSGDICVAADMKPYGINDLGKSLRYHQFFQNCCNEFPNVIYISGNHEHYHGDFKYTITDLKKYLAYLPNLHVLEKETFEINDTVFICGTLWTDMNKEDPLTLHNISQRMNDFRCVKNSNNKVPFNTYEYKTKDASFSPQSSVIDHKEMLEYISKVYADTPPWKQIVVVGHHTPSYNSCHPIYKDDTIMNGGYHSDLSEFILDRPGIKLWTHGHTHDEFDYMIGDTRVVCNPRGYIGHESRADNFELKVVKL